MEDAVRRRIDAGETELSGQWSLSGNEVVADAVCERIHWLTTEVLDRLADNASGWDTLFVDPADGRLWERSYPRADSHGGGPPQLRVVTKQDAVHKYGSFDAK
jgi:hypothetical protein